MKTCIWKEVCFEAARYVSKFPCGTHPKGIGNGY
jgi:hypothetical protein